MVWQLILARKVHRTSTPLAVWLSDLLLERHLNNHHAAVTFSSLPPFAVADTECRGCGLLFLLPNSLAFASF